MMHTRAPMSGRGPCPSPNPSMLSSESGCSVPNAGAPLSHIRVHQGTRTHSGAVTAEPERTESYKTPNVRMMHALTQWLRTMEHREKRMLYPHLRDPRINEHTLLTQYGASMGEVSALLIVGEQVRYRHRAPRARKTAAQSKSALLRRRARRLALPPGALSAQRQRAAQSSGAGGGKGCI